MTTRPRPRDDAGFFVGYLPIPWAHSRFLRFAVPATLTLMAIINGLIVWRLRPAADGVWRLEAPIVVRGVLRLDPYPMLVELPNPAAPDPAARAWLIVEELKRGGQDRCQGLDGAIVQIEGYELERDGLRMLALPPTGGIRPDASSPPAPEPISQRPLPDPEPVRLTGEVMDAKCWLGAMRPGEGIAHSPCAALCVRGGIPPLLVVTTPQGPQAMILTGAQGQPTPALAAGLVGLRAHAEGTRRQVAPGVWVLAAQRLERAD